MKRTRTAHPPRTRAFSLIELLIVIGIIGVLVGIVFAVGKTVNSSAKRQLTQDAIAILDTALAAYMDETGGLPPAFVESPTSTPANPAYWPMADARDMQNTVTLSLRRDGNQMINSLGLFIKEASSVPRVRAILDKLPPKLVVRYDADNDAGVANTNQPELTTVLDAWGNPIRFVHPVFDGRIEGGTPAAGKALSSMRLDQNVISDSRVDTIRRNHVASTPGPLAEDLADSDGGRCTGNRPYFYSAGEDGLVGYALIGAVHVGYNDDNVYTNAPSLPPKPTP